MSWPDVKLIQQTNKQTNKLLTGQKVGNVGNDFPTFTGEASRFQITLKNRALISHLYLNVNIIVT